MTRLIAVAVVVLALCAGGCAGSGVRTATGELPPAAREAPDRYVVVTVRNETTPVALRAAGTPRGYDTVQAYAASSGARADARDIAADYGLTEAGAWPIQVLHVHCIVYALPANVERTELIQRLAGDKRVESVQPLGQFSTQTSAYNDPYAGLQQSLAQMAVPDAQRWSRGAGVRLALIDTGVDLNHPDLRGRIAAQQNFVDTDAAAFNADRHGTAVAGVITAVANNRIGIAGIAPEVTLLAYKACWTSDRRPGAADCNTFTLAQALAAALEAKADIVNLSLAGPADPLLSRIVERGLRQGIVFVGAAPPEGARDGFPGNVAEVIAVDAPGRLSGLSAPLVAPGRDVLTLVPGAHYDFASGSSLAAAQVSAVVALLLARERKLDASTVQRLLERTSQAVAGATGTFHSINACAALVALRGSGSCPETPAAAASSLDYTGHGQVRIER